jgi:HPt (histidine-containing phosphotransfer) domain-containing protein
LQELPEQIEMLKESVAIGNIDDCRRVAHGIKGAASNMGGNALSEAAHALERAADRGDLAIAGQMLTQVCTEFDRLSRAMRDSFAKKS